MAIRTGVDLRPEAERQPTWCRNAELIVARALKEEARHAKLFRRVNIHADVVNLRKYSEIIQFRVQKFECRNQAGFLESTGRDILRLQGIRGALIAESIPSKYTAEVEIEFKILDAATQRPVFAKTYTTSRTIIVNGYQGAKPKVEEMSAALEDVITQFIVDLTRLPLSRQKN